MKSELGLAAAKMALPRLIYYFYYYYFYYYYYYYCPEAEKPKTFRVATFYTQKLSGRSARNRFSRQAKKARFCLSQHCQRMRNECPLALIQYSKGQSSGKIQTVLNSSRKLAVIWKNSDSFETIRKIGNHL